VARIDIALDRPLDAHRTLAVHWRGPGDATWRFEPDRIWWATRAAGGPAVLAVEAGRDVARGHVRVEAWGPGADDVLADAPALLGLEDDPDALETDHPLVRDLQRRFRWLRIGRTGRVLEALIPAITEQKVTGEEARRAYRHLVRAHGDPAPIPEHAPRTLRLPPDPARLARLPYYAYHPLGLERRRAETIRRVASQARRLEQLPAEPREQAYAALTAIPGVGPWTAAEVGLRAFGDPDAVSVGDFHIPAMVCWALGGEANGTDERMLELLEPFRGQRGRVIRLLELGGRHAPRRGPRMAPRRIESI
jgi:3-methyladenine DNA glycosylase/8-oxoguanine DNA glycosylase